MDNNRITKKMLKKHLLKILFLLTLCTCSGPKNAASSNPSWFLKPKQNNLASLYGIGQGFTLEDATKSALADAASRLIVTISSESTLLREENNNSSNEETRQQIKQNIEKIEFTNFVVSQSEQIGSQFFVEIKMPRDEFISLQKEKMSLLDQQIENINKNLSSQNLIQKRNSLINEVDMLKQSILLARILESSGENAKLKEKMSLMADAQNQLNKLTDKVEFYFEINSSSEISAIIRTALNKEKIKISKTENVSANQVKIAINSSKKTKEIYGAHITKIKIDFENKSAGKIIASNSIEISGSSSIDEKYYFDSPNSFGNSKNKNRLSYIDRWFYVKSEKFKNLPDNVCLEIFKIISNNNLMLIELICSLYERVIDQFDFLDHKCLRACCIIFYHIAFRKNPDFLLCTVEDVQEIKRISQKVEFNFISWVHFFRLIE